HPPRGLPWPRQCRLHRVAHGDFPWLAILRLPVLVARDANHLRGEVDPFPLGRHRPALAPPSVEQEYEHWQELRVALLCLVEERLELRGRPDLHSSVAALG